MPTRNHTGQGPHSPFEEMRQGSESTSVISEVADKTKKAATFLGEKADDATEAVGKGMESLGGVIREHEPKQGVLHNAGEAVADKLEGGGRYLEEHGLTGIGEDITNMVRRHPIPALLVGIGVGVLLAKMMRR